MRNDKENLIDLLKLIQITRTQPQYGYALSNLKKHELSNLAEHHYLVTFIAMQLTKLVNTKGAKIDIEKVLEICLVHDLGELFGGDISRPYAMVNPKARKLAKAFEAENQKFLRKYFIEDDPKLWKDVMEPVSDEGLIAKIADYMECAHYLKYVNQFKPLDVKILADKMPKTLTKIKDKIAKKELALFLNTWIEEIQAKNVTEILFD
jgi:5'-deoxynucleotidase YfbR-like HD superfamily hydrolase